MRMGECSPLQNIQAVIAVRNEVLQGVPLLLVVVHDLDLEGKWDALGGKSCRSALQGRRSQPLRQPGNSLGKDEFCFPVTTSKGFYVKGSMEWAAKCSQKLLCYT